MGEELVNVNEFYFFKVIKVIIIIFDNLYVMIKNEELAYWIIGLCKIGVL